MIIFLYGQDGYRLNDNFRKIIESYKAKYQSGFNLFNFDFADNLDFSNFEDAIKSASFFSEIKLIAVKNPFSAKKELEKVIELMRAFDLPKNKEIVLLFGENKTEAELNKLSKDLLAYLKKNSEPIRNFEQLKGAKLEAWLGGEVALAGSKIQPLAIKKLIDIMGGDSWALSNEINKLCNYRSGGTIGAGDVSLLASEKIDLNIFDLVDALGSKSKAKAFELLYKEISTGRDPYYILTMAIYQFRNLLIVKDLMAQPIPRGEMAKKAGLHPFVVQKALASASKFSMPELKNLYTRLLEIDISTKTGRGDLTDYLFGFVLA